MNRPASEMAPATIADFEHQLTTLRGNYADLLAKYEALKQTPSTIVVDLTGGALHAVYATQPIEVVMISHDSDDIARACDGEPEHLALAVDGKAVYLSRQSSEIDADIVAHYRNQKKG
jgi:hypothetical protein